MAIIEYLLANNRYLNLIGIVVVLAIAWLFSKKRQAISYRLVFTALAMQILVAITVLGLTTETVVKKIDAAVEGLLYIVNEGSRFVFGNLIDAEQAWGFVFAFRVLPVTIFFAALTAVLFHFRVIQFFVSIINAVVQPLLGTSGVETLCAISNSFLGQTEAPLLIRDYLAKVTKSELLTIMVSGMATISGAVFVIYYSWGIPSIHLLAACLMGVPASILMSKILYPEMETPETKESVSASFNAKSNNVFDAIAIGTSDGLHLALAVGAMLISFIALFAFANTILGGFSTGINCLLSWVGIAWKVPALSFELIFSYLFAPFGYLLGFTGEAAMTAGKLLGVKLTLNEMVAYKNMVDLHLSNRMVAVLTYALCGFANFSSIGVQVAGISALVPERRHWLAELGIYAVLGGTLANLLSAMIAGLLI